MVRYVSVRPFDEHWRAWVRLRDARSLVLAGGRLGACARREIGLRPHDLFFALLPDELVLQVLKHESERPRHSQWQNFVRAEDAIMLIRAGGRVGAFARLEFVDRQGKHLHDLFFDLLPDVVVLNVIRFVSTHPCHPQWQNWISPNDVASIYEMGGRIAAIAKRQLE